MKLPLFTNDMILYVESPKFCNKLVELVTEFSNIVGYKINMQKLVVFALYINNEQCEMEVQKTVPIRIASKRIKYLGMNFQLCTLETIKDW